MPAQLAAPSPTSGSQCRRGPVDDVRSTGADAPAPSEQPAADVVVTLSHPRPRRPPAPTELKPCRRSESDADVNPARDTTPAEATVEPAAHTSVAEPDTSAGSTVPAVHSLTVKSTAGLRTPENPRRRDRRRAQSLVTVTHAERAQPCHPSPAVAELPAASSARRRIFGHHLVGRQQDALHAGAHQRPDLRGVRGVELLLGFDRPRPSRWSPQDLHRSLDRRSLRWPNSSNAARPHACSAVFGWIGAVHGERVPDAVQPVLLRHVGQEGCG